MPAPDPTPDPAPASFHAWCTAADAIRATTKRLEKSAVLEAYFPTLDDAALPAAARFFSGIVFPRHDMRVTQVGGSLVAAALAAVAGADPGAMHARTVAIGDLGDTARALLEEAGRGAPSGRTLAEMEAAFAELAATAGSIAKRALVERLLAPLGAREAQYAVKLLLGSGELRIGLKEAQVEEALARAFGHPLAAVRRANLLRGDVGEVAVLTRAGALATASLALFHPIGFMLAQPLATAEEIAAALPAPFAVEDKYDGIRAQAHVGRDEHTGAPRVALFSRTLDEITRGYPEVVEALAALAGGAAGREGLDGVVLDGELLAYDPADPARARPFKDLQRRLGRKTLSAAMLAEVPVQLVVYDVVAARGVLVVDESYAERRARLERVPWPGTALRLTPVRSLSTAAEVDAAFDAARAAGNEGVIAKDFAAAYTPGRRGKAWIKLKKATETLDVVITGAEWGHGRRAKVLSDYTFAVRASESDPTLLNVGKAYNGLTDLEIAALTERLQALTVQRFGRFQQVRPEVVLEVTFDAVQASGRHKAGYALRFPRILRVRDDKPAAEVDTLERVRALAGESGAAGAPGDGAEGG
jgi:DNA ligase-1